MVILEFFVFSRCARMGCAIICNKQVPLLADLCVPADCSDWLGVLLLLTAQVATGPGDTFLAPNLTKLKQPPVKSLLLGFMDPH